MLISKDKLLHEYMAAMAQANYLEVVKGSTRIYRKGSAKHATWQN
jgi:hypothetical protein